jgi:hypothetical protein
VHINASPQRTEKFQAIQERHKLRLKLLQDVKTRWNSTLIMLVRFVRLEKPIGEWMEHCEDSADVNDLALDEDEWTQVKYIIQLTKPFALYGYTLGACSSPTVQHVFSAYNDIFDHLDEEKKRLGKKRRAWKKQLLPALQAAQEKLTQYYSRTTGEQGRPYNYATVLNPVQKLSLYDRPDWESHWKQRYLSEFEDHFKVFYELNADGVSIEAPRVHKTFSLDHLVNKGRRTKKTSVPWTGELAAYLNERKFRIIQILAIF